MDGKQFGNQLMNDLGLIRDRTAEPLELARQTGEPQSESDLDTINSHIAEIKANTAELQSLVRQAWSAGTLDSAAKDLREGLARLADLNSVAGGMTTVKHQQDIAARPIEKCDMITERVDRITSSMDTVNALIAASVRYDGSGGDRTNIIDAMFIAQCVVGV